MDDKRYCDDEHYEYFSDVASGRRPSVQSIKSMSNEFPMAQFLYDSYDPDEIDTATTFSLSSDAGHRPSMATRPDLEEPQHKLAERVGDSKGQDATLALAGSHLLTYHPAGAGDIHINADHRTPFAAARNRERSYLPSLPSPLARDKEIDKALNGVIEAQLASIAEVHRGTKRKASGRDANANANGNRRGAGGKESANTTNGRPSVSFTTPFVGPCVAVQPMAVSTQVANIHDVCLRFFHPLFHPLF